MATYVVGDIQGCFEPLQRLLATVAFAPGRDQLWCVGDMVNRGPQSLETLLYLEKIGSAFTGVLGNHDLHFLAVSTRVNPDGKLKSLRPLLDSPKCKHLFEWTRQLPLAHQQTIQTNQGLRNVLMIHAGIAPTWNFITTQQLAAEVSDALRGPNHLDLLRGMYGDEPARWDAKLQGIDRLRVITNVLTRLRFCTAAGDMNLTDKGEVDTAPPGYRPWFDFQQPAGDELLLFGHWATLDGVTNRSNILGLDTGCVWGRCMTLLHLEKLERVSVSCDD